MDKLIREITACKTQEKAIKLAAELVLQHTKGQFQVLLLEKRFGDAILDLMFKK